LCDGCGRTIHEIAGWVALAAETRDRVLERVRRWTPREGAGR
jgi:predicted Fe-S protein YdhL (DUF1289 family)